MAESENQNMDFTIKKIKRKTISTHIMNLKSSLQLLSLILFLFVTVANAQQKKIFISPTGNDQSGKGTKEQPYRTIYKARDEVRTIIAKGLTENITIFLRGGKYYLDSTLIFRTNDGGNKEYRITYCNYEKEKSFIIGGKPITNWKLDDGNIYKADIGKGWNFHTLFEADLFAFKARNPNAIVDKDNYTPAYNRVLGMDPKHPKEIITIKKEDMPAAEDSLNLEFMLWPGGPDGDWNWFNDLLVAKHTNPAKNLVTLQWLPISTDNSFFQYTEADLKMARYEMGKGSRYYLQGSKKFLDAAGEFYIDKLKGQLYYYPRNIADLTNASIIAPTVTRIVSFEGSSEQSPVKNISFQGITFSCSDRGTMKQNEAIFLENAADIEIKNCDLYNLGANGICGRNFVQKVNIEGNNIHSIGETGVYLISKMSFTSFNLQNRIVNNYIHNMGMVIRHGTGIQLDNSEGNYIAYNRIHNTPRYAFSILFLAPDQFINCIGKIYDGILVTEENLSKLNHSCHNLVEFNDFSDANTDSQDTGVMQSWGGGVGNTYRNNWIHDSQINFSFGTGIYIDYSDSICLVKNLVTSLQKTGQGDMGSVVTTRGTKHFIANNIIADNHVTGVYNAAFSLPQGTPTDSAFTYVNNISSNSGNSFFNIPQWRSNRVKASDQNLFYNDNGNYLVMGGIPAKTFNDWRTVNNNQFDQFSLTENPLFADAKNGDYRLMYNSPAYSLGFEDLDFQNIGLHKDFVFADPTDQLDRIFLRRQGDKFNPSTVELKSGESCQLELLARTVNGFVMKNEKFKTEYSSENPAICSVNINGILKAVSTGIAKIKVTVSNNGIRKSTFVYVLVGDKMTALAIKTSRTILNAGKTIQINVAGITNFLQRKYLTEKATYTLSNPEIATISKSGLLVGKKNGTTNVVVRYEGFKRMIAVEVTDNLFKDATISIDKRAVSKGEKTQVKVAGTLTDGSVADLSKAQITYHVSDTTKAAIDKYGSVTALNYGRVTIDVLVDYKGIRRSLKITMAVRDLNAKAESPNVQFMATPMLENVMLDGTANENSWKNAIEYPLSFNQMNEHNQTPPPETDLKGSVQFAYRGDTLFGLVHRTDDITFTDQNPDYAYSYDGIEFHVAVDKDFKQLWSDVGRSFNTSFNGGFAKSVWSNDGKTCEFALQIPGLELTKQSILFNICLVDNDGGGRKTQLYPVPGNGRSYTGVELAELYFK